MKVAIRKLAILFLATFLVADLFPIPVGRAEKPPRANSFNYAHNEILVKFKRTVSDEEITSINKANGVTIRRKIPRIEVHCLKIPPTKSLAETLEHYKNNPKVEYAEPDYIRQASIVPNDPSYSSQWALPKISAPQGWNITTGSSSVTIAVLDTGIDYSHPDLSAKMWLNADEIPDNSLDDDGNGYVDDNKGWNFLYPGNNNPLDDNGHGTHVAGIAAAATNNLTGIAGVSWGARLMPLRVLDSFGYGYDSDVAEAIAYAVNNGAKVINLSLGGSSSSDTLLDAVNDAWGSGCVIAAAAGNSGSSIPWYPAAYDNCISVAATDSNDSKASFSNFGSTIDIAAPGVDILSTYWDTHDWHNYLSLDGTSMATPHVAGLASLLFSQDSGIINSQVRSLIENNADDLGSLGWDQYFGNGRINLYQSLLAGDITPPSIPTGLIAQPGDVGDTRVELTWNSNSEPDLAGYNLYRSQNDINYSKINAGLITATGYTDNSVTAGTTYYYKLSALDIGDNESSLTGSQSATPTNVPPDVPTGLSALAGNQKVDLVWNPNAESDLAGYNLYRSQDTVNYTKISPGIIIAEDYSDTNVVDGNTYYYKLTAEDSVGLESLQTTPAAATVDNTAPTAEANGPYLGNEGSAITFSSTGSTDNVGIVTYEWDFDYQGEGTFLPDPLADNIQSPTHTYLDNGTVTVALRVSDAVNPAVIDTATVTVNNVEPAASATNNGPKNEGSSVTVTASQTDPGTLDAFTYSFDWNGDGDYVDAGEIADQASPSASYAWNDNGTYIVRAKVKDDDGGEGTATTDVTVNDLSPTASLTGDTTLAQGQTGSYNASGSTSSPDAIAGYEWDWSYDGTFIPSGDTGATHAHSWYAGGNYTVAVRVTDDDGSPAIATLAVTVNAAPPGSWQLGNLSDNGTSYSLLPSVASDSSGNTYAVWEDDVSGNDEIYFRKSDGGSWSPSIGSPAINISNTPTNPHPNLGKSEDPDVAVDSSGKVHIVWMDFLDGNFDIYYRNYNPSTDMWTPALSLPPANISNISYYTSIEPSICTSQSGIHVVWEVDENIYYTSSSDGLIWSYPANITGNSFFSHSPDIAKGASNTLHLVYRFDKQIDPVTWNEETYYRKFDGSSWSPPTNLSNSTNTVSNYPKITSDSGAIYCVWEEDLDVYFGSSADGTLWNTPQIASTNSYSPAIATGSTGNIHTAYASGANIYYKNYSSGSWSAAETIVENSGQSDEPAISVDSNSRAHVLWQDSTPTQNGDYWDTLFSVKQIVDTTPPTTPSGLSANAISSSQINLSWSPSADNVGVVGYKIERSPDNIAFSQIDTSTNTSYSNTGLNPSTIYYYRIRAYDAAGNNSDYSSGASATTQVSSTTTTRYEETSPAVSWTGIWTNFSYPSYSGGSTKYTNKAGASATFTFSGIQVSLIALKHPNRGIAKIYIDGTPIVNGDIALSGDTGSDKSGVDLYRLTAKYQSLAYTSPVLTSGPHTITIEVTGLKNASATNSYADVDAFDVVTVSTDTTPPTAPSGLSATAISSSQINLSWSPSVDNVGVVGYKIERSPDNIAFSQIDTSTNTSYSNTGLNPSTIYYYRIRAYDQAGNNSDYSSGASATTQVSSTTTTRYEETSPGLSWTGTWTNFSYPSYSGGSTKYTNKAGASATFTFSGIQVSLIALKHPNRGIAKIYIDGTPIVNGDIALSGDTGSDKSGVDLYRLTAKYQSLAYTSPVLTSGSHTIAIEVTGLKNASATNSYVDVDAFDVVQ